MQLLYFPGTSPAFLPINTSIATRVSFLLADTVILSPHTHFLIGSEKIFQESAPAQKTKIVLEYFAQKEPEKTAVVRDYQKLVKKVQALKRKGPQDLVILRKWEQLIESYYASYVLHFKRDLEPFAIQELSDLLDHKEIRGVSYSIVAPEAPRDGEMAVSQLLQAERPGSDPQEPTEDVAFLLPFEFLSLPFMPAGIGSIAEALPGTEETTTDTQAVWAMPLVELPNVNRLSVAELEAVRQQLREPSTAFRAAADAWIADCCHQNRRTVRERARFVEETLLPAAASLQEVLWQDKIMTAQQASLQAQGAAQAIYLFVAEMPLRDLWAFYEKTNSLHEDTLKKLRAVWETRGLLRCPVFLLGFYKDVATARTVGAERLQEQAIADQAAEMSAAFSPASVRKSIDL